MELSVQRVLRERRILVENLLLKEELKGKHKLEKLNRELTEKVDELNTMNKILRDFTTSSSSTDVFSRMVDLTVEVAKADESKFYVVNESTDYPVEIAEAFSKFQLDGIKNEETAAQIRNDKYLEVAENADSSLHRIVMDIITDEKTHP